MQGYYATDTTGKEGAMKQAIYGIALVAVLFSISTPNVMADNQV
jgi:hypothetical protein